MVWCAVMLRFALALLATFVATASRPNLAHAAETADELYRRGVAQFRAGQYEPACKSLAQSHALEPLPGVLFTLATCEARAGRPATAAAHYDEFINIVANSSIREQSAQQERRDVAVVERDRALARAARLQVEIAGALPAGAELSLDGRQQEPASFEAERLLDPGGHTLALTLRDGRKNEQRFVLAEGERRRTVLQLPPSPLRVTPTRTRPGSGHHSSPWLYVTGVTAGAGLTTGIVTGLLALERKGAVNDNCEGAACNEAGKLAADTARSEALASSIAFGVAGVGTAAFVALWLLEPKDEAARGNLQLGVTPTGALLRGHF